MDNLYDQLKKLGDSELTSLNPAFKRKLRGYLVNEYRKEYKSSFFKNFVSTLRFQSALNLSVLLLSFITITTVASYIAMPDTVRDQVKRTLTGTTEYNFDSSVKGSNVILNGEMIGMTPLEADLKEGNYAVRVEHEGYEVYTNTIKVEKDKPGNLSATLVKLPDNSPYAGWLRYNNDKINLSFLYPAGWNIEEKIGSSDFSDFKLVLSNNLASLELAYNAKDGVKLSTDKGVKSYKRVLSSGMERFIQFTDDGNYLGGGIKVLSKEAKQNVLAKYSLSLNEDVALKSDDLKMLDMVIESMSIGDSSLVVAQSKESESVPVNQLVDLSVSEETVATSTQPTTQIAVTLDDIYSNRLYDYFISFPSNWRILDSRANYPINEQGDNLRIDGKTYTIAQLRLKSATSGIIYLSTTVNGDPLFEENSNICGSNAGKVVAEMNGYKLVQAKDQQQGDYNYQVCKNTSGEFKSGTGVRYSVFWDIENEDFSDQSLAEFKSIFKSLRFVELSGSLVPSDKTNPTNYYTLVGLGATINTNGFDAQTTSCDEGCTKIDLFDGNTKVLTFSNKPLIKIDEKLTLKTTRDIGGYKFDEYYKNVCDEDGQCVNEFAYGICSSSNLYMYYTSPITERIASVVMSIVR